MEKPIDLNKQAKTISLKDFKQLGGKLIEKENFSKVFTQNETSHLIISESKKEYVYHNGEVFFHSESNKQFIKEIDQDIEVLKKLIES